MKFKCDKCGGNKFFLTSLFVEQLFTNNMTEFPEDLDFKWHADLADMKCSANCPDCNRSWLARGLVELETKMKEAGALS